MLPTRNQHDEDDYLAKWQVSSDTEGLIKAITAAITENRPQLAARLVGLLDDHLEVEPGSAIERAHNAARLLLAHTSPVDSFEALEAAWLTARRQRMRKITRRMRQRAGAKIKRRTR